MNERTSESEMNERLTRESDQYSATLKLQPALADGYIQEHKHCAVEYYINIVSILVTFLTSGLSVYT